MSPITKKCKISGKSFVITDKDQAFYKKMGVPLPALSPDERQRRRLAFRNERHLYHNTCGLCKKEIITTYSPDSPYPVYCTNCWWGDGWDPMDYGRDFDFSRPFFEQFKELWDAVPKLSLLVLGDNENSDFTHDAYRLKNCYLTFDGEQAVDCYYGETFDHLKDCMDFLFLQHSELCYELVNCTNCYNVNFSRFSQNCADSNFLLNCKGCRNCFGCVNLHQKEYHIFNKPYSPEEYERIVKSYNLSNFKALDKLKSEIEAFFIKFPKKVLHGMQNENVTGDNLISCKDTFESFDCTNLRDCKYCTNMLMGANDCHDINIWGDQLSLAYNGSGIGMGQNIIACYYVAFGAIDAFHSAFCLNNIKNILGCVGLRQKENCILNKQYSQEKFDALLPRIKEHMEKKGEWGEFFPPQLSAFGYNETVAHEYFPLNKKNALTMNFKWKDPDPKEYLPQTYQIPDDINDVPYSICQEILACSDCRKNYKIVNQELIFYKKKLIPIPRKCSDCRHLDRQALRNPRQLWERICDNCGNKIETSCSPEKKDAVYCEKCFLETVY